MAKERRRRWRRCGAPAHHDSSIAWPVSCGSSSRFINCIASLIWILITIHRLRPLLLHYYLRMLVGNLNDEHT